MGDLGYELNRLAGTTGREVAGAANVWAGTTGRELVGALNAKAGTKGLEFDAACRAAAVVTGASLVGTESGLEALRAALTIPPALSQPIGGWYDAKDGSGLQEVPSRITGTDLMTLGSTSGADSNDPTWTDTPERWVVAASDYFQLLASDTPSFTAAAGKYSAVVTYKPSALDANDQIIGANSASSVGLRGHFGNQYFRALCGGSTTAVSTAEPGSALTLGQKHTVAVVVDDGSMWAWDDINGLSPEVDITGVGTITFNAALRIATRGYGVSNTPEGDYYAIRTLPGVALTASELADISDYLLGDYS